MSTKQNLNQEQPDPTLATPPQGRPDVTRTYQTVAGELAGVAERSGAWLKEEAYKGFQDLAGRLIYGETKAPEIARDKEPDHDLGRDR